MLQLKLKWNNICSTFLQPLAVGLNTCCWDSGVLEAYKVTTWKKDKSKFDNELFIGEPRNPRGILFNSYFKPRSVLILFGNGADLSCHVFYLLLTSHENQNILPDKQDSSLLGSVVEVIESNLAGASEWIVKIVDNMARNQSSFGSDICLEKLIGKI